MHELSLTNNRLFRKIVTQFDSAFEWGSGDSTLYMAQNMDYVTSIEHNSGYYESKRYKMPKNSTYVLCCPDLPHEDDTDGTEQQYENYCRQIDSVGDVDVIIVDGRARMACVNRVFSSKISFRRLLVHDFYLPQKKTREAYTMMLSVFHLRDWHDGLAVFEDIAY